MIRYRRICSKDNDFLSNATTTKFQLISRGYDYKQITKIINTLVCTPRSNFLEYKDKKTYIKNDTFILSKLFDFNINNTKIINNSLVSLSEKFTVLKHIKTNFVNKIQPNLGALLINNIFSYKFNLKFFNYIKCKEGECKICEFSLNLKYIYNKDFFLPVSSFASCESISIIYFIFCSKCNAYYIGELKKDI